MTCTKDETVFHSDKALETARHTAFWKGIATVLEITSSTNLQSIFIPFTDMPDQGFINLIVKECGLGRASKYGINREGEKKGVRVKLVPFENFSPLERTIREALLAAGHDETVIPTASIELVAARVAHYSLTVDRGFITKEGFRTVRRKQYDADEGC